MVDKAVTPDEMERLAKAFGRETVEVKSEGYLNNLELHFSNEAARHKLLDVIGDLALIGYPIKANIIANRPGHSSNVEFAKQIKQYIKKNKHTQGIPVYDLPNRRFILCSKLKIRCRIGTRFFWLIRLLN